MATTLTKEDTLTFEKAFKLIDKDGDGFIYSKDLGAVMHSLGQNFSDAELEAIINEVDADGSGSVDVHEFLAVMSIKVQDVDVDAELRRAFQVFDRDNSGTISRDELWLAMNSVGENFTSQELDAMMEEADKNGDGLIDYNEFVKIMKHE